MRVIVSLLFFFCQLCLSGQGTVLNSGQSGSMITYSTLEVMDVFSAKRLHSFAYGYSLKRAVDFGLQLGSLNRNKQFGMSLAFYTNTKSPIDVRMTLALAKASNVDDIQKGVDFTAFFNQFTPGSRLTPRVGWSYSGENTSTLIYGADLRVGDGSESLLAGINFINPKNGDEIIVAFSIGILFAELEKRYSY